MKWRIRKCGHGGYEAEKGMQTEPGTPAPSGIGCIMPAFVVYESPKGGQCPQCPGCIMPAFVVYESAHFDTYYEAERYIEHRQRW